MYSQATRLRFTQIIIIINKKLIHLWLYLAKHVVLYIQDTEVII